MTNSAVERNIAAVAHYVSLFTIGLFPVFFLPTTPNFYDTNKLALLIVATSILLGLFAFRTIATKSFRFELYPFTLPMLLFGLFHLISPFISQPKDVIEALMSRGSFFITLGLFITATINLVQERRFIREACYTFIGSASLLSVISLFQSFGFGLSELINRFAGTSLPNNLSFTPAGTITGLLSILVPAAAMSLVLAFTKSDAAEKVSLFILSAIIASGVLVVAVYSLPGKESSLTFLPLPAGYAIAIETLKLPQTALFGVGTNSFTQAFTFFKPAILNGSNIWNLRFNLSSNELLQLITTVGLIGTTIFTVILSRMIRLARQPISGIQARSLKVTAFTFAILFFLIPGSYPLYFGFFLILGLWAFTTTFSSPQPLRFIEISLDQAAERPQTIRQIAVFAPPVLLTGVALAAIYGLVQTYSGEMIFRQSLVAAANNDGLTTYNLQRDAILKNPYLSSYRRAYATTNLALANAIASNAEMSDQDRQNVAQLIQQAIREAKIATSINPNNVSNWETLAGIYQALINGAEGADQWTIAALAQAIQTDPLNPALRVELGGVYYSLKAYDQAIRLFQQAAELKPDYANAYYNLSHAYQEKRDVGLAFDYMRQTLSLSQPDSADYTKAREELEALSKLLPNQNGEQSQLPGPAATSLKTTPPATESSTPVDLPSTAGPENVESSIPTSPTQDISP